MQKKIILLAMCWLMVLLSCKKESDTTLKDINEIGISGIASSYSVLLGAKLTITPELKFTMDQGTDASRYQYEWFAADSKRTDLATTRNLDKEITLKPGVYDVYYRVRDTQSGVQWSRKFSLSVVTSIYEGWMVLNDVNGSARLDMLSVKDDIYTPIHDVLAFTGSKLKLQGTPVNIACFPYSFDAYGIYVTAKQTGTTKIDPESFDWNSNMYVSYESLIPGVPENYQADFVQAKGGNLSSYMYKDGDVYFYNNSSGLRYSVPINLIQGTNATFKAAPYISSVPNGDFAGYGPSILYDATNRKFVRHLSGETKCAEMPAGTLFDFHTGKDLVYMASTSYNGGFAAGDTFAILKDPNAANFYLARISLAAFGTSFQQNYYDTMNATNLSLAENFAVSPEFGYVFYNVGGKVYEYDIFSKNSKLMLDKGSEKISMLKFHFFNYPFTSATTKYSNKLIVGSYDPSKTTGSNGKMELYTVPAVNGDLVLDESYTGFGKIVGLSYRERK